MPNPIREKVMEMAASRAPDKTVCPSEVARALFGANWRSQMAAVREQAVGLYREGLVLITQKGQLVDPDNLKGPVRIRLVEPPKT